VGTSGAAGLQAQLKRFEHELSDCVNCASSKTPEGKAAIEVIQDKITGRSSYASMTLQPHNRDPPSQLAGRMGTQNARLTALEAQVRASSTFSTGLR
jgi:hypothetical protein